NALDEHRAAAADWRDHAARPLYPDDFPERLGRLESLWRQRDVLAVVRDDREAALQTMRRPTLAGAAAGVPFTIAAGGAALVAAGNTITGLAALAAGLAGGIAALLARQRMVQRRDGVAREAALLRERLADAEEEIADTLAGLPDADTLTAGTA